MNLLLLNVLLPSWCSNVVTLCRISENSSLFRNFSFFCPLFANFWRHNFGAYLFFAKKWKKICKILNFGENFWPNFWPNFWGAVEFFAPIFYTISMIYIPHRRPLFPLHEAPQVSAEALSRDFGRALKRENDTTPHFLGLVIGCIDGDFCKWIANTRPFTEIHEASSREHESFVVVGPALQGPTTRTLSLEGSPSKRSPPSLSFLVRSKMNIKKTEISFWRPSTICP